MLFPAVSTTVILREYGLFVARLLFYERRESLVDVFASTETAVHEAYKFGRSTERELIVAFAEDVVMKYVSDTFLRNSEFRNKDIVALQRCFVL